MERIIVERIVDRAPPPPTMSIDDTAAPYVLEGTFGQPAEPAPPSTAPPEYVNEGLARWNAGRQAWLEQTKGSGATTRPRPKDLEVDEVIETIFSPQFGGKVRPLASYTSPRLLPPAARRPPFAGCRRSPFAVRCPPTQPPTATPAVHIPASARHTAATNGGPHGRPVGGGRPLRLRGAVGEGPPPRRSGSMSRWLVGRRGVG